MRELREKAESVLLPVVGLTFWGINRAVDMQMFQFGQRRHTLGWRGREGVRGDYGLHVQCPWRIVGPEGIVVGSHDVYYPPGDPDIEPPDFKWDTIGANRRDQRLSALFAVREEKPFVVTGVIADNVGGVTITLSDGYKLELWPYDSRPNEHWRLLQHHGEKARHFVMTGAGIEED